jgi:glutamate-1-semialdehyde 2,1-aminomutase
MSRSAELFERARRIVPAGVNSNTRARQPHPVYFAQGQGAWLIDADGQRWLDLIMGNGAILLGHGHPEVQEAVREALAAGLTTGIESALSVEVAELFLAQIPSAEMVRFTAGPTSCSSAPGPTSRVPARATTWCR